MSVMHWSTNSMAMDMNGWFGDGNGYVGNLDLKPETAHTLSFTAGWHDSGSIKDAPAREWELKVTPYYTYVVDYIDVDRCVSTTPGTACTAANASKTTGFVALQFANHDAEMYGFDVSGRMALLRSGELGRFDLSGVAGYVHARRVDNGDSLYHVMPLNAKLALEHKLGNWSSSVEWQLVDAKSDVEQVRNETQTPGYSLVNLRTSYQWDQVRLDAGVENLFDKQYYSPLGGAYLGDRSNGRPWGNPVAGAGRTVFGGITIKF